MDEVYARMQDDVEKLAMKPLSEDSEICKFYSGRTILITGCNSSFLGKCVVEKLLRSCPDIKQLYLLVQPESGTSPLVWLNENYLRDTIFDMLRKRNGDGFAKKVVPIESDFRKPGIGLSKEGHDLITEGTELIIHNAAIDGFNSKNATETLTTNVIGTQQLLELALQCTKLQAFLHVSTAYSAWQERHIEERIYGAPGDLNMIKDMIRADTENKSGLTEEALCGAFGPWQNIYAFSEATAESLVERCARKAPFRCIVFRPTIVSATLKDPAGGCIDNSLGLTTYIAAVAKGMVHALHIRGEPILDLVPADMTANALLAAMWDVSSSPASPPSSSSEQESAEYTAVYNYGSSVANPILVKTVRQSIKKHVDQTPPINGFWYHFHVATRCYPFFLILNALCHLLPAVLADVYLCLTGKKPFGCRAYREFSKHMKIGSQLIYGDWRVHVSKMTKLWDRLNPTDKELFYSDIRTFDWTEYLLYYWRGIRVHALGDSMNTVEASLRRYNKLRLLHYSVLALLLLVVLHFTFGAVAHVSGYSTHPVAS